MSDLNLANIIKNIPLFSQLNNIEIEQLAQRTQQLRVTKNTLIFKKGDPAKDIFMLVFGKVKLFLPALHQNESEHVFRIIMAGESFAEAVSLLGRPYPANAMALEDCLILAFKVDTLLPLLQTNQQLSLKMLAGLSTRIHLLLNVIDSLRNNTGLQRCIHYILSLAPDASQNSQKVHLPTTKQNIASLLNIKPETFSRYLANLEKAELIKMEGRELEIIDSQKLRQYGEEMIEKD